MTQPHWDQVYDLGVLSHRREPEEEPAPEQAPLFDRLLEGVDVADEETSRIFFEGYEHDGWAEVLIGDDSPTGRPTILVNDRKFEEAGANQPGYRERAVMFDSLHMMKLNAPEEYQTLRDAAESDQEVMDWAHESYEYEQARGEERPFEQWWDHSRFDQVVGGFLFGGDPSMPSMADWNRDELPFGTNFRRELQALELREFGPATGPEGGYDLSVLSYQPGAEEPVSMGQALGRGVDVLQKLSYDFADWVGEVTGSGALETWAEAGSERQDEQIAEVGPRPQFFEEDSWMPAISSFGELNQFFKETVGEMTPLLAPSLASGAAGAAIGSVVPVIGTTLGGLIGAFLPAFMLGVGEVQGNLRGEGIEAPMAAFLGGSAIAALDTVLPGKIGGRMVRAFGRETAEEIAEKMLSKAIKPGMLRRIGREGVAGFKTEAITEAFQEAVGEIATAKGVGRDIDWAGMPKLMAESGIAGGIMGLLGGGSSGVLPDRGAPPATGDPAADLPPTTDEGPETGVVALPPAWSPDDAKVAPASTEPATEPAELTPEQEAAEVEELKQGLATVREGMDEAEAATPGPEEKAAVAEKEPAVAEDREFASTQVNLSAGASAVVQDLARGIKTEDLAEDGRETQPHITVKYGLEDDAAIDTVRELLADEPPIRATLGETSIFPASETGSGQDVVKVDVVSEDLARINAKIAEAVAVTDSHPDYQPHVTLAYVKPGTGQQYAGQTQAAGKKLRFKQLVFSTKAGEHIAIPLGGKATPARAKMERGSSEVRAKTVAPKKVAKPAAEKAKPSRKKAKVKGPATVQLTELKDSEKLALQELLDQDKKPPTTYGQTRKQFRAAITKFLKTGKPTLGSNTAVELIRGKAVGEETRSAADDLAKVRGTLELEPSEVAERIPITMQDTETAINTVHEWLRGENADIPATARAWVEQTDSATLGALLEQSADLEGFFSQIPEATGAELVEAFKQNQLSQERRPGPGKTPAAPIALKGKPMPETRGAIGEPVATAVLPTDNLKSTWALALRRPLGRAAEAIRGARLTMLIQANIAPVERALGVPRGDIARRLRSWTDYRPEGMTLQRTINANKPLVSHWTGIQNTAQISTAAVNPDHVEAMVKQIDGSEDFYESDHPQTAARAADLRAYLVRAFLGIDTRIDFSDLSLRINSVMEPRGQYTPAETLIEVKEGGKHTLAHEIGHYLDNKWAREAGHEDSEALATLRRRRVRRGDPQRTRMLYAQVEERTSQLRAQWMEQFDDFVADISMRADTGYAGTYRGRHEEVFARFMDKFMKWTERQAGVPVVDNAEFYKDQFTDGDMHRFIDLLQQKAFVDAKDGNKFGVKGPSHLPKTWRETDPLTLNPVEIVDGVPIISTGVARGESATAIVGRRMTNLAALSRAQARVPTKGGKSFVQKVADHFLDSTLLTRQDRREVKTADEINRRAIDRMKDNLRYWWDSVPTELRERSKKWYDGANRVAKEWADEFGYQAHQVAGVMAALSPQKDWFVNLAMAERMLKHVSEFKKTNQSLTTELFAQFKKTFDAATVEGRKKKKGAKLVKYNAQRVAAFDALASFKGMHWNSRGMDDTGRAVILRAYDELQDRSYDLWSPEGDRLGKARRKPDAGKLEGELGQLGWTSYDIMSDAISILGDGEVANLSRALGNEHKVRSFYNNIIAPWSAESVTIDTHAVAAAFSRPLAQKAPEVAASMGTPASDPAGLSGTNAVIAQAYFELANELGVLPRELQSVTWERARSLFTPERKRGHDKDTKEGKPSKLRVLTERLLDEYNRGKISQREYQDAIKTGFGGFTEYAWAATEQPAPRDQSRMGRAERGTGGPRPAALVRARGQDTGGLAGEAPRERRRVVRSSGDRALADAAHEKVPTFFSKLRQVVEAKVPAKASIAQVSNILRKGGVKQDELDWTGVEEWLKGLDGKSVTRAELEDYLEKNGLELQETELGASPDPDAWTKQIPYQTELDQLRMGLLSQQFTTAEDFKHIENLLRHRSRGSDAQVRQWFTRYRDDVLTQQLGRVFSERDRAVQYFSKPTQYEEYTATGGEEYRELLIQIPEEAVSGLPKMTVYQLYLNGELSAEGSERSRERWLRMHGANADIRSIERVDPNAEQNDGVNYRSGHFDEPNIVAHIRYKTRTGPKGEKVLAIEEVQSDWHQQGRKYGYDTVDDPKRAADIERMRGRRDQIKERLTEQHNDLAEAESARLGKRAELLEEMDPVRRSVNELTKEQMVSFQTQMAPFVAAEEQEHRHVRNSNSQLRLAEQELSNLEGRTGSRRQLVPDAPFKTSWAELSMKRMLRYAADQGHDMIAWTTGQQQADRYDLSQRISRIMWNDAAQSAYQTEGTGLLTAWDSQGHAVVQEQIKPENIGEFVGEDIAARLLALEPRHDEGSLAAEGPYHVVRVPASEGRDRVTYEVRRPNQESGPPFSTRESADKALEQMEAQSRPHIRSLEGLDLKTGGEGMKTFYDKMLPSLMKKFGKKWGATVESVELKAGEFGNLRVVEGGSRDEYLVLDDTGLVVESFVGDKSQAEDFIESKEGDLTMHSMRITPEMRDSLLYTGQPLFEKETITREELEKVAKLHGSSVETQAERFRRAGYEVPDFRPTPRPRQGIVQAPPAESISQKEIENFPSLQKHPADIRPALAQIIHEADGFQKQRRGVQTWERTEALARGMELPLSALKPGTAANAEELSAYANAITWSLAEAERLEAKGAQLTQAEILKLSELHDQAIMLVQTYRGLKAETGRALNVLRTKRTLGNAMAANFIEQALAVPGFKGELTKIRDALGKAKGDPVKVLDALTDLSAHWFDYVQAYAYNNMLSGLKTHLRNFIGNSANLGANILVPLGAAPVDIIRSKIEGRGREVYLGESMTAVRAALQSSSKIGAGIARMLGQDDQLAAISHMYTGWQSAAYAFTRGYRRADVDEALEGNFDTRRVELKADFLGFTNERVGDRLYDFHKMVLNWPSRALVAGDEFFRTMARNAEKSAATYAQARKEGLTDAGKIAARQAELLTATKGEAFEIRKQIEQTSDEFAARMVFQERPGPLVQAALKAKNHPAWGVRLAAMAVAPFVRTPGAILKQGIEWSPFGAFMTEAKRGTTETTKGETRQGIQAQGRIVLGSLMSVPLVIWAASGRLIGAPPDDRGERDEFHESGKLSNSIRVPTPFGDMYVRYVLFQPFSVAAAAIANMVAPLVKKRERGETVDEGDLEAALLTAPFGALSSLLDQSFLSGVDTWMSAMQDPERSIRRVTTSMATPYVPWSGAMRNLTGAVDGYYRRPQSIKQSIAGLNPFLSETLRPIITRHGSPAKRPPDGGSLPEVLWRGFMVPMISRAATDKVVTELARLEIRKSAHPGRYSEGGESFHESDDQRAFISMAVGFERKVLVEGVIEGYGYDNLTDEAKIERINDAYALASRNVRGRIKAMRTFDKPWELEHMMSRESYRHIEDPTLGAGTWPVER